LTVRFGSGIIFLAVLRSGARRGKQRLRNKGACENKPVRLQV
jgi:hypothetical protein